MVAIGLNILQMATYKTPGVYIEEISSQSPSIVPVDTAIPGFIGYTEKAQQNIKDDLVLKPKRIGSLPEYEFYFGKAAAETGIEILIDTSIANNASIHVKINSPSPFRMYYALQFYFANGGGDCYIISAGSYPVNGVCNAADFKKGLDAIGAVDEMTIIVFPDAMSLTTAASYYNLYKDTIQLCALLQNRFTIMDVWKSDTSTADIAMLRAADLGEANQLSYAAAYYPFLITNITYYYEEDAVAVKGITNETLTGTMAALQQKNNTYYTQAKIAISKINMLMPAAPALAGIYANVDNERGVWKAPANVAINLVINPELNITSVQQQDLNVDAATGRSINCIRNFPGRGTLVWGARTLAGNSNEWRYISVRRMLLMVETSIKRSTSFVVFEPNTASTWIKLKSSIENFLANLWKAGALSGSSTKEAFFVKVGIGETMTAQDLLEGTLVVVIGVAITRPAEFIILQFSYKMQAA